MATKTEKINWGVDFDDVFIVNMDTISFNGVEAIISINCNDIHTSSEDDSELYVTELTINKKLYKTVGEIPLYLNAEVLKFRDEDSDTIEISSAEYPEGDYLFKFVPKNNEMTKSLQQILDLLETSDHLGMETYDDFINKFSDLLVQNELSWINLVHPEIISSNLIVNKKNGTRADFTKDDVDYTIARVSRSILNSPLSVSFAFERINDQLSNLTTYEKDRESIMDFLFK